MPYRHATPCQTADCSHQTNHQSGICAACRRLSDNSTNVRDVQFQLVRQWLEKLGFQEVARTKVTRLRMQCGERLVTIDKHTICLMRIDDGERITDMQIKDIMDVSKRKLERWHDGLIPARDQQWEQ